MTDSTLLDTHIALWLDSADQRLRQSTRELIDGCWRNGGSILISAVSVWEIALLVDSGRIRLDCAVEAWVGRCVGCPGTGIVLLTHHAAAGAYRLYHLERRDLGDRLLIATAIE